MTCWTQRGLNQENSIEEGLQRYSWKTQLIEFLVNVEQRIVDQNPLRKTQRNRAMNATEPSWLSKTPGMPMTFVSLELK
jgi:hypothetical protein